MDPRTPNVTPPEIPPDVEARYKEIQEELQRLELSPEATSGESREARFARLQRIKALRREFDRMSRVPFSRRRRQNTAFTVLAMFGIAVMLCALSIGGGMLLAAQLNRPPDVSSTATHFLDDIKQSDYSDAFQYLSRGFVPLDFNREGSDEDTKLGPVTNYQQISQTGGKSGDTTGSATYKITRQGTKDIPGPITYDVVFIFNYTTAYGWQIADYGTLFSYCPPKAKC